AKTTPALYEKDRGDLVVNAVAAPSSAKASAVTLPMPDVPPATSATRSWNVFIGYLRSRDAFRPRPGWSGALGRRRRDLRRFARARQPMPARHLASAGRPIRQR